MNEIKYNNMLGTCSQIVVNGLIASNLLHAEKEWDKKNIDHINIQKKHNPQYGGWYFDQSSKTSSYISEEHEFIYNSTFEESIGNFYAKLLGSQEQLGPDFEDVLHRNLWDLYES